MKPNSVLRTIADDLKLKRPPRRKNKRGHCDHGHPIDLRYDDSFYRPHDPAAPRGGASSRDFSADNFATPFVGSEAGNVEAFEDEQDDSYASTPWGTGQLDEEEENSSGQSYGRVRPFSEEAETPVSGTAELQEIDDASAPAQAQSRSRAASEDAAEAPVWGTAELEELAGSAETPEFPTIEDPAKAAAASVSRSHDPETAAFQDDLKAILAGKKAHPSTADPAPTAASTSMEEDVSVAASAPLRASGHTHQIFEKMGANMSLATTYNLGSFAVDRQMDVFDRKLDREERAAERRRQQAQTRRSAAASTRISSSEFAEDLAAVTMAEPAAPVAPPAASVPATRGNVSRAANAAVVLPIATTILGGVMTRLVESQGDVTWELEQLKGLKRPGDDAANTGDPHFKDRVLVFGGPITGGVVDDISADFRIRYQFNGRSLGNIQITNDGVNDAVGWGLSVKAQIMDDAKIYPYPEDPTGFAALRVVFTYRFTRTVGSDQLAERVVMLFGDGNHTETVRWIQNETLSLPVTRSASRAGPTQPENPS